MEQTNYLVQKITHETEGVRTYTCCFGLAPFDFEPGQFSVVTLGTTGYQGPLTFSSSPLNGDEFDLTVKRTGGFGTYFYDHVQEGDILTLGKPSGPFKLDPYDTRPICFLARDYCTPAARSFIQFLVDANLPRRFYLFHEGSDVGRFLFEKEFQAVQLPGFYYLTQLDTPDPPLTWTEPVGRITAEVIRQHLPELYQTVFYLTGEGADVRYFRDQVQQLGVPPAHIRIERWS